MSALGVYRRGNHTVRNTLQNSSSGEIVCNVYGEVGCGVLMRVRVESVSCSVVGVVVVVVLVWWLWWWY